MNTSLSTRTPARRRAPIVLTVTALIFEIVFWVALLYNGALKDGIFSVIDHRKGVTFQTILSALPVAAALVVCLIPERRHPIGVGVVYALFFVLSAIDVIFCIYEPLVLLSAYGNRIYAVYLMLFSVSYLCLALNAFTLRKKALCLIPAGVLYGLLAYPVAISAAYLAKTDLFYDFSVRGIGYVLSGLAVVLLTACFVLTYTAMLLVSLRCTAGKAVADDDKPADGKDSSDGGDRGVSDGADPPAPGDPVL